MSSDLQKTVRLLLKEYVAPARKEGKKSLVFSDLTYSHIFIGTSVTVPPPMREVADALSEELPDGIATYNSQTEILWNGVFSKKGHLSIAWT